MEQVLLSVIIPVYNTEKFLTRCIDSVILSLSKAVKILDYNYEIIIINDASKGNADEIVESYIKDYGKYITYIKNTENKGRGITRNIGIENAKGKYISFVDSDDYVDADMYYNMLYEITSKDADIVVCDIESVSNKDAFRVEAKNIKASDDRIGCFDMMIMPSPCNKVFKRKLFDNIKFPDKAGFEDLATIPIIMLISNNIIYLNKMYYKYYTNLESIMNSEFNLNSLMIIDALNILFNRMDELNIEYDIKEKSKYMVYTRRFYEELLENIMLQDNKKKVKLIKTFCDKIGSIQESMFGNRYFMENIKRDGTKKYIFNVILHKAIINKRYNIVKVLLSKGVYYRLIAIKYENQY